MQFVRHGPDIPERLLQAHEDGRVVFFCGAGISYPARLPGFAGLVKKLYDALSVTSNPVQQSAIKAGQFDTAIGLLESEVVGGRETVRRSMAAILTPDLTAQNATATHEALLTLARNREGRTRLITTNFDRLFEEVKAAKSLSLPDFKAPLLPVPKARWDGLVYLHGLLPITATVGDLDRLVVSSGDFGLAYLTERWAARFVSELFRNFTVCFVGYSINDPVLRYMMDALAADRLLGESPPEMFAFGSYSKGKEMDRASEWKAKNVTPILYREHRHHAYLHKTLRAWANTYRDGVRGKERIVVECAIARPLASTKQDDFVGRMLWALSDPGGLPAKRFAELEPVPLLDWLEPLSEELYRHADLGRFSVPPQTAVDDKLAYSLISRPTPYLLAPWMRIVDAGHRSSGWDAVMFQLARWLLHHLDDPKLLIWLIKRGGQLHNQLIWMVERRLDDLSKLENSGNTTELDRIRASAPSAIPRPAMRTLWRLLLNGHVRSGLRDLSLYRWHDQFKQDGLTASVRLALRETLTPCLSLREPFRWSGADDNDEMQDRIRNIVEWEVVLASDFVHSGLRDMPKNEQWAAALPELLDDFSALLRDALDLMRELGDVDSENDHSYVHQPSISDHSQNKDFHDWTALIDLTRDAWLAISVKSPARARVVAEAWAHGPYPIFRRLALFAATQGRVIPIQQAIDWLLADGRRWLWSEETRREAMRLLVSLAPQLDTTLLAELEQAVLSGPPHGLYRAEIDPDDWNNILDHGVWLRLAKMAQAGANLSEVGQSRLDSLSARYPWQLATDESDEFPIWMGGGWVGDRDPWKPFTPIPRTRRGVLDYLLAHPVLEDSQQDDWRKLCSEMFQATAYALCKLAQESKWPAERWRDALQAWAEEKLRERSWRYMAPVVSEAPDDLVQALAHGISWWLEAVAKTFKGHEGRFLTLVKRILRLDFEEDDAGDPVFRAINHPVGHVTQALLDCWYRQEPDDGQGLPEAIKSIFTELCDTQVASFRHGRVLLSAHALSLFRVDEAWSEQHLQPLFDWNRSETEAQAAWEGFLWSPRLYRPLLEAIKPAFLDTVNHYAQLGKHKGQFAAFLTFAALDPGDTFTVAQLATAVRSLPADGLRESAQALVRALEGAGDQREDYWKNRVLPFWERIWPKSNDQALSANAESLARLCVAAGGEFPSAMAVVGNWLRVAQHPDYAIRRLQESGLSARFPEHALRLLFTILGDQPSWLSQELRQCLDAIGLAAPDLLHDPRYMRLDELARRFGV